MADKIFIGQVTEIKFNNGGSMIKLSLSDKDKELLKDPANNNIAIKKSQKGNWYAEIDFFQPKGKTQQPNAADITEPIDDLPF